ncbi:MAG: SAM-dependent methyltransferase [Hyphomonadaceae bacterium]|nr:SAM-dependent methyltransferase [Clostridia bacterium]
MKQPDLSPRLLAIAHHVKPCHTVADIGTDHAYIPIWLTLNGIVQHAIAADVKKGPIQRAKANIASYDLSQHIETRLGDGLAVLAPDEAQGVIIAGMGGILTCALLQASQAVLKTTQQLILQPMQAQEEVRKWLFDNAWHITQEMLVKEGDKRYHIIVARQGLITITNALIQIEIGEKLLNDPFFGEYMQAKMTEFEKIMTQLQGIRTAHAVLRRTALQAQLRAYQEVLKEWRNT